MAYALVVVAAVGVVVHLRCMVTRMTIGCDGVIARLGKLRDAGAVPVQAESLLLRVRDTASQERLHHRHHLIDHRSSGLLEVLQMVHGVDGLLGDRAVLLRLCVPCYARMVLILRHNGKQRTLMLW